MKRFRERLALRLAPWLVRPQAFCTFEVDDQTPTVLWPSHSNTTTSIHWRETA